MLHNSQKFTIFDWILSNSNSIFTIKIAIEQSERNTCLSNDSISFESNKKEKERKNEEKDTSKSKAKQTDGTHKMLVNVLFMVSIRYKLFFFIHSRAHSAFSQNVMC